MISRIATRHSVGIAGNDGQILPSSSGPTPTLAQANQPAAEILELIASFNAHPFSDYIPNMPTLFCFVFLGCCLSMVFFYI